MKTKGDEIAAAADTASAANKEVAMCKGRVWDNWHLYPCARKATRDGWCGTHHPDTKKRRQEKRAAKDAARRAEWDRQSAQKSAQVKDAARYRWLRERINTREFWPAVEALDAAIDAALQSTPAAADRTNTEF